MNTNPYAPPKSEVSDQPGTGSGETGVPVFFPASRTKLLILSLCTLGLYEYYWFYKNWRIIRNRTNEDISPFWRAFFAVFFCYQLFDRVRKQSLDSTTSRLPAGIFATAWIVLTILWKLPDPYWLVTYLAVLVLLPVQHAINAINQAVAPNHDTNSRFSAWNWVAVGLGGPIFLLALYVALLRNQ